MLDRMFAAGALVILGAALGASGVSAQEPVAMDPQVRSAPRPAADTREPGKTATDAVTNPAAVPPSEGSGGTGKPPRTGSALDGPPSGSTPAR